MSHLSELRKFRKIAVRAVAQFPLSNPRINYIGFTENVVYKISAQQGEFILRIHAASYRTQAAIEQELNYISTLRNSGFNLQKPLNTKADEQIAIVDGFEVSVLSWQKGRRKRRNSIADKHFIILGEYLAKLHDFSEKNKKQIKSNHREFWTADQLLGKQAILGSSDGLESINSFNREVFDRCKKQTYERILAYQDKRPETFGMIHADLHFSNIIWRGDELLPIDFDDCGLGSFLHDLSIPIVTMNSATPQHHRELLLNAYSQTRPLNQNDLEALDDFILTRHIVMQGWLMARSGHPKIKKYLERGMQSTMKILKNAID